MAELAEAKRKRGQIKGCLTRFKKFYDSSDFNQPDNKSIHELKRRLDNLTPLLEQFNQVQAEIDYLVGVDQLEAEESERVDFEKMYYSITGSVDEILQTFSDAKNMRPNSPNSTTTNNNLQLVQLPQLHLPVMKVPIFNGNYDGWVEFKDAFKSIIDSSTMLSDVQKMYHLKNSLGKEALETIKAIPSSAANYKLAWEALEEQYEKSQLIVRSHVRAILDFPRIVKQSTKDLKNLYNTVNNNLQSLKALGEQTDYWDTLLIPIITDKCDSSTKHEWETFCTRNNAKKKPGDKTGEKLSDLFNLLKGRHELLQKLEVNPKNENKPIKYEAKYDSRKSHSYASTNINQNVSCFYCKKDHTIYKCESFLKHPVAARLDEIKRLKLCKNCMMPNHSTIQCKSSKCRKCGKLHNSLLHLENFKPKLSASAAPLNAKDTAADQSGETSNTCAPTDSADPTSQPATASTYHAAENNTVANLSVTQVLLPTAMILVQDLHGRLHQCRALLDSGSMSNFVTKSLCDKLSLTLKRVNRTVTGVGKAMSNIQFTTNLNISSNDKSVSESIQCLVISQITTDLPAIAFNKRTLTIPHNLKLADPKFNEPASIDLLLGSTTFWELLGPGKLQVGNSKITLHETKLGWIIAGEFQIPKQKFDKVSCFTANTENNSLEFDMATFWNLEEVNVKTTMSASEQMCETHFKNTHRRSKSGRFIVSIPFKENHANLGHSRESALKRFYSQERRLIKNPQLYTDYLQFMAEYESLGHMAEIKEEFNNEELNYYLPHHAVIKESSRTTKVRIVFDASMKSNSGLSLNDVQHVGPTIQPDLFTILLRFRTYQYVMTADISKMYRMVLIEPNQTRFQRIFWRNNMSKNVKCYELKTVTYGTASAPYLAIRCLFQLASEYENTYPSACEVIRNSFYVDDLLCGANTEAELIQLQHEVSKILASAGFDLRKWLCNKGELCEHFQINSELESSILQLGENESNKTLGICWNATLDTIQYSSSLAETRGFISKRTILSEMSQIFDPLGLLGPVIITAKIIMQRLWEAKISWDDPIPQDILNDWLNFRTDLTFLDTITIPRQVTMPDCSYFELHGFADASERAYGACIYIRCKREDKKFDTKLVCAKSRVAPLKRVTLPRLELCSAVLLAQLVQKVQNSLSINFTEQYLWSDSQITLAWIQAAPNRWKTFVANRVSEIQQLTDTSDWHHVASKHNPADLLSRGASVIDIKKSTLWWSGPAWLENDHFKLSNTDHTVPDNVVLEQRIVANITVNDNYDIFNRYSSFLNLRVTVAWCLRFISNCKLKTGSRQLRRILTTNELQYSSKLLVKLAQQECFPREYNDLRKGEPINAKSKLLTLNPFMDDNLLRVGGRLKHSNYDFDKKHPIILPAKHKITKLILKEEHSRLLHCGPTMLLSSIREKFWPISGRNLAKGVVRDCITCFKVNPKSTDYLMGDLPQTRVQQYIPFFNTGVDYAGPFLLKDRYTRAPKLIKGYVCLFVCLATKAVHLEAVSDLTSKGFMASLRRFMGRRGKPSNMYSDNGRNFIGACNELKNLKSFLTSENENICKNLANQNITWHCIPARSPNFGGLWEAGIKSAKFHLKRVVGNAHLNFEDFTTVLVQIESILNSRPLCPLTSSPDNLNPLTPGHFLIGRRLTTLPEPNYVDVQENRLKRFERLQQIIQHFWARWHKEYISELQTRVKWKQNAGNSIQVGSIVLLKEENVPPLQWRLGRISELHPGRDGIVRVVSVKLKDNSATKRAVTKICVLPCEPEPQVGT